MKVDAERFGCNNLLQDFKFIKNIKIARNISPIISSNIYRYFNNSFHEFKVLKKVIVTETFNVDFRNKFIKFWSILFFQLFFIYIYIYIYI